MVRNYVRRTSNNTYDVKIIISALKTLRQSKKSVTEIARYYNMKMSALSYHWRRHNKENIDIEENVFKKRDTRRVLSKKLEEELLLYIMMCAEVCLTVGSVWIRQLAYELAIENKVALPPNWKKHKIAGKEWYLKFKDRHSKKLSKLIPDSLTFDQIMGTHRSKGVFFRQNYSQVLAKYKFQPKDVFILEECKLQKPDVSTTVENKQNKKQDCAKNSTTKGQSRVTFFGTVSAIGQTVPPFYIFSFPRYQKHQLLQQAPKGCKAKSDPTGTMTKKIFLDYLKHFVDFVGSNVNQPVLLLLEYNRYHMSLGALKYAKENGIVMLTFPPRTRNKVQILEQCMCPLTKIEFKDFKEEDEITIEEEKPSVPMSRLEGVVFL